MTPREIDARIAAALFGRKIVANEDCEGHETDGPDFFFHYRPTLLNPPMEVCAEGVPPFSAMWEGMGLVASALSAKGWDVAIYQCADTKGVDVHIHRTSEEKFYESGPHASASEAPEAVCLAALRALGEEV